MPILLTYCSFSTGFGRLCVLKYPTTTQMYCLSLCGHCKSFIKPRSPINIGRNLPSDDLLVIPGSKDNAKVVTRSRKKKHYISSLHHPSPSLLPWRQRTKRKMGNRTAVHCLSQLKRVPRSMAVAWHKLRIARWTFLICQLDSVALWDYRAPTVGTPTATQASSQPITIC